MDKVILEWRILPRNPLYEISNYGEIRYAETKKLINQYLSKKGYLTVCLRNNSGPKRPFVHRLVLEAFIGPRPSPSHECAHGDGTRDNNHISNLRWATTSENQQDRQRHGTSISGQKHPCAKLTNQQAKEIIFSSEMGTVLAKKYGCSAVSISNIKRRKTYKDAYPFKFWMAPTPKNLSQIHD